MSNRYGSFGGPNRIIEAYISWRDQRLAAVEEGLALEEADMRADFPEFLFGPVRTSLWHGYQKVTPNWQRYARKESLQDFRERRLRGINALKGISYVGESGHYEAMKRTERLPAVLAVDTYGGVYSITRHAIRNDDTGDLLNRNPEDMGYAMAVFVMQTLVALIESNPIAYDGVAFYDATRGNIGTAPLSEDSLADALAWMESQNDDDGFPIMLTAATLAIKSPRLHLIAQRILGSPESGAAVNYTGGTAGIGSAFLDKGTTNPLSGIISMNDVVRERFFTDATDWRLFANPSEVPAFAMGFLDGKEEPFIGLKNLEARNALGSGEDPYTFEFDSVDFKLRHDFGVAAVDPKASFWSQAP